MSFGPSITSQFEPSFLCVVVRGGLVRLVLSVREVAGTNPALLHDAFFLRYGPGINRRFDHSDICSTFYHITLYSHYFHIKHGGQSQRSKVTFLIWTNHPYLERSKVTAKVKGQMTSSIYGLRSKVK